MNITDEHRSIDELLGELEQLVAQDHGQPSQDLHEKLSTLATRLVAHFETEGESDLYTDVADRMPELAAELSELRVEHGSIIEMLDDARGATRRVEVARSEATELVRGLISAVRTHEHAEEAISWIGLKGTELEVWRSDMEQAGIENKADLSTDRT